MQTITRQMLLIKSLDNDAYIGVSEFTGAWYLHADIHIGGDGLLTSPGSHFPNPEDLVQSFLAEICNLPVDKYIVINGIYPGERREMRWNGAAFYEVNRHKRDDR